MTTNPGEGLCPHSLTCPHYRHTDHAASGLAALVLRELDEARARLKLERDTTEREFRELGASNIRLMGELAKAEAAEAFADKGLTEELEHREFTDKIFEDLAFVLGCEEEWSNLHSHYECVSERATELESKLRAATERAEKAEAERDLAREFQGRCQDMWKRRVTSLDLGPETMDLLMSLEPLGSIAPVAEAMEWRLRKAELRADKAEQERDAWRAQFYEVADDPETELEALRERAEKAEALAERRKVALGRALDALVDGEVWNERDCRECCEAGCWHSEARAALMEDREGT